MEALTLNQIAAAVHGRLLGEGFDAEQTVSEVCTDSRKIKKGCLFLPLVGEKFDGHDYIGASLEAGAAACLTAVEPVELKPGKAYIRVENTQDALRDLASWYRGQFPIPVVAVTGSVGKTTT